VRPHIAIVTTVEPVHLAFFESEAAIAEAKAEIFEGLEPGGTAILNRDNKWFDLLSARTRERGARIVTFGEHASADIRLERISLAADSSRIDARLFGEPINYKLGAPGRHLAQNSLAVIAAAQVLGVDMGRVVPALARFSAPKGRGERTELSHLSGKLTLIDESYNANPASMRAALALLAQAKPGGGRGRRIAVLGDMLELGDGGPAEHRALASAIETSGADLVFLAGQQMADLWRDLPDQRRGAYAGTAAELEPILLKAIGPGDVIMMKASLGTRLGPVVEALKRHFSTGAA
jgi:UDP-N-acetylmuramyl pentapeptide synthase